MSFRQYEPTGSNKSIVLLIAGVLVFLGVLVGAYVFATGTSKPQAAANTNDVTETTLPRVFLDPEGIPPVDSTTAPILPDEDYLPDGGDPNEIPGEIDHENEEHEEEHEEERVDYSAEAIPPDKFAVVFSQKDSGLTQAEYDAARRVGAGVITALIKGEGRANYPQFKAADEWPDPYAPGMVVDFSHAQVAPLAPELIRTVVIWHGSTAGGTEIKQARVSQYLRRNADGTLTPLRLSNVPINLQRSDGLLKGITIFG